jgi:hypothetical protein
MELLRIAFDGVGRSGTSIKEVVKPPFSRETVP